MPIPTAEQILYVLNDCEPFDLEGLEFCVITRGSRYGVRGERLPDDAPLNYWPFERGELLMLRTPWGREPLGQGRDPSSFSVGTFETKDYDAALALSDLIKSGLADQGGMWEWLDGLWVRPDDQAGAEERRRQDRGALIAQIGGQG